MNEIEIQEEDWDDFDEFPEEIPDKAKPKMNFNERKTRFEIYVN